MTYRLWIAQLPPSFNKVGYTGNRWAVTGAVKEWKELLSSLMLVERLPRDCSRVHAKVVLTFPLRRRRDVENYRVIISKALGDALVEYGVIPDDTIEHWTLELALTDEPGDALTEVFLSVDS